MDILISLIVLFHNVYMCQNITLYTAHTYFKFVKYILAYLGKTVVYITNNSFWFSVYFWDWIVVAMFLSPFFPSSAPICPFSLCFRFYAFFSSTVTRCIFVFVYTYRSSDKACWIHIMLLVMYAPRADQLVHSSSGKPPLLLPALLSCLWFSV